MSNKAHKHAAMIKAKADNMELVVFVKNSNTGDWFEVFGDLPFNQQQEFFMCLPQHKEACLHFLNGGKVQLENNSEFFNISNVSLRCVNGWSEDCAFMRDNREIRIKPRKAKRWIAACNKGYNCIDKLFDKKEQAKEFVTAFYPNNRVDDFQFIEIEVEV